MRRSKSKWGKVNWTQKWFLVASPQQESRQAKRKESFHVTNLIGLFHFPLLNYPSYHSTLILLLLLFLSFAVGFFKEDSFILSRSVRNFTDEPSGGGNFRGSLMLTALQKGQVAGSPHTGSQQYCHCSNYSVALLLMG